MNEQNKIPKHIGIIMDGNRRWAKERNLPTFEGHFTGYKKVKQSSEWFFNRGVKIVSYFAFSTENWKRASEEVNYLMKLLKTAIEEELETAKKKGYRLIFSGRIEELPGDLPDICSNASTETTSNSGGTINICLNYGGKEEIVDAFRKMINNNISIEQVHSGMIKKYLYNGDLDDPDIIVRTSGEQRLSGFLLWQSDYSELIFLKKYWPEFEESDVNYILDEYNKRARRFGE